MILIDYDASILLHFACLILRYLSNVSYPDKNYSENFEISLSSLGQLINYAGLNSGSELGKTCPWPRFGPVSKVTVSIYLEI